MKKTIIFAVALLVCMLLNAQVGAAVLSASSEEINNPALIPVGLTSASFHSGTNYFKFTVEPGYFYSFIVNSGYSYNHEHVLKSRGAPAVLNSGYTGTKFQAKSYSTTLAPCKDASTNTWIPEANNPSYAKSAIMFYADPNAYSGTYYNYVQVDSYSPDPASVFIRLVKIAAKGFSSPFSGGITGYYNSFGHREDFDDDGYCTNNGHDGIDIAPYNDSFALDLQKFVLPVASGEIIRTTNLGSDLGYAVWIYHSSLGYTSVYAHLQALSITSGSVTKGVTKLGTVHTGQKHLHLEILPGRNTIWYQGYSSSSPHVDPLQVIFEK